MVKQYPYSLYILNIQDATQNENGDFIEGSQSWGLACTCRDEANTKSQTVLVDSVYYPYDSIIYTPKSCPILKNETKIEVRQGGVVRLSGVVKRFSQDQLHSRIWP